MSFLTGIIGAGIFLIILLVAATIAPKYFRSGKSSAPDAGADAAASGSYGSYALMTFHVAMAAGMETDD